MSDITKRLKKAQERAKSSEVIEPKKKVFKKFKHCKKCHGTLQLADGKPCECRRIMIKENLLKECGIKEGYYDVNFDFYQDKLYDVEIRTSNGLNLKPKKRTRSVSFLVSYLQAYIDTFENRLLDGRGFILSGSTGGAKTGGVSLIIKELALKYYGTKDKYTFQIVEANDMLDMIFDTWDDESPTKYDSKKTLDKMRTCDLLAIDDIGAEYSKNDAWIINQFLKLIKGRKSRNKPTIVTTNYSREQLLERFSEELYPRLSSVLTESMEVIMIDNPVDVRDRLAEEQSLFDIMSEERE